MLLGLGQREELRQSNIRTIGARLVRGLERLGIDRASIEIASAIPRGVASRAEAGQALGEGIALGNWRFDEFDGTATNRPPRAGRLALSARDGAFASGIAKGIAIGDAVNYARRLAATPPNVCNPPWVAAEAKRLARSSGADRGGRLSCRVIDFGEAKRLGMGGIVNVGRASTAKPCLVMIEHKPKRVAPAARGQRVALVGKTLTYDTGGYSLKINNGMKGMKYDKCGGTAVLGAMKAIADAAIPVHVCAFLPAAENMVAGDAYRPDDIITMYNGVSVEVTNTDAEGRLVLADALAYACKTFRPTAIVDLATLTGGVVVALGAFSAGLFCNDAGLRARVQAASDQTGEKIWHLPLWPEHREFMRSQHADVLNSNPKREAHPIQGAAFLSYFVDAGVPWAHLDVAGVSNTEGATDLCVAGPTGWGVRLLVELVERFARA
ncbi:MAG: leucyl aminopeptidase family protein [Phycisphaerales bacterium]